MDEEEDFMVYVDDEADITEEEGKTQDMNIPDLMP